MRMKSKKICCLNVFSSQSVSQSVKMDLITTALKGDLLDEDMDELLDLLDHLDVTMQ